MDKKKPKVTIKGPKKPTLRAKEFRFELEDGRSPPYDSIPGRVVISKGSLDIFLDNYGTNDSLIGYGSPIVLDLNGGELKLLVWSDINQEEPTDTIDMRDAREDRRSITDEEVEEAWQEHIKNHIKPSRLFAIATDLINQTDADANHFKQCPLCLRTLRNLQGFKDGPKSR